MKKTPYNKENRHELKFIVDNSAVGIISEWLRCRCLPDPKFPAGIVSSIYYDTANWQFMREKINSDYHKTKIRLRWYADIDSEDPGDESYMEAKFKTGSRRNKIRVKTGLVGDWLNRVNLENKKLLLVPQLLRTRGVNVASTLLPVFRINYKRKRFIEPLTGARLSLDYDISSPCVNRHIVPRSNPFRLQNAVFELKGVLTELPEVLHQLTAMGCQKQSFSKYSKCYENIMGINF